MEELDTKNRQLEIDNLNQAEALRLQAEPKQTAESASQVDRAGPADGDDDACRKPGCMRTVADYAEARTRFQRTVEKLTGKLELAMLARSELANRNQELEQENEKAKKRIEILESELRFK